MITLVAKSHDRHVELALRTTLEENLEMVRDTVSYLVAQGRRVFVDCEHFFDGYRANPEYAKSVVRAAHEAGADLGGDRELVGRVVERVKERELQGYTYEAADASFELLLREEAEGRARRNFRVES